MTPLQARQAAARSRAACGLAPTISDRQAITTVAAMTAVALVEVEEAEADGAA